MNYDLIKKLAKLANNNPSENEANAAARKVCKLLAEGNYNFNISPLPKNDPPINPQRDSFYGFYDDLLRNNRWSGFDRDDNYYYQEPKKEQQKPKVRRTCFKCTRLIETYNTESNPFICDGCLWDEYNESKKPKERQRQCSECNKNFMTASEDLYVRCPDCTVRKQKAYERKHPNKNIHQCKCGETKWYWHPEKMNWICNRCAFHVSIIDAVSNDWVMQ